MAEGDGGQVDWLNNLVDLLRRVHDEILRTSGGVFGEHTSSLYSACARPFQSAFGEDVYTTTFERAAALFHAIICDHAFVDGNKRTGTAAALLILRAEGTIRHPSMLQVRMLGDVALSAASGDLQVDDAARWIRRIFDPSLLPDASQPH